MKEPFLEIAKIVGKANSVSWAQVHSFFPQDEDKEQKFGNLIATISLTAREKAVDIGSFGTEIISRLQETYYSSQTKTVLEKLKETLEKLKEEFNKRVELAINLAVVLPKNKDLVLYVASNKGRVAILREGNLGIILKATGEKKNISGFLRENDLVVVATEQFFEFISEGVLKASMESKNPQEMVESLAPIIHRREINSQTAAVFIKVKKTTLTPTIIEALPGKKEKPEQKKKVLTPILKIVSNFFTKITEKLSLSIGKGRPSIYIRKESTSFLKRKKTNFTIAIIMICLLLISIIFGLKEKGKRKISSQGDWVTQIEYQLNQVALERDSNPLKAKTILKEVEEVLEEKEKATKDKNKNKEIESLKEKLNQLQEEIRHQYKIDNPEVFLDLSLVKEEFKGSGISFSEGKIVVLDKTTGIVIDLDLETKSSKIVIGNQDLQGASFLACWANRIFVLKDAKIFVIDEEKGEIIQEKEIGDLGKAVDLTGFSDNCYLLDETKNRLLKFPGFEKGLSSETDYLKREDDLSQSTSLSIDGSAWVLFSNGKVNKYTQGQKDAFLIMGLDEPFNQPISLYTDKDCDNLYILDRNNLRTVVVNKKSGDYQGTYIWPGMAGAIDFVVSEEKGKMLFLTGTRIYEIGLKK